EDRRFNTTDGRSEDRKIRPASKRGEGWKSVDRDKDRDERTPRGEWKNTSAPRKRDEGPGYKGRSDRFNAKGSFEKEPGHDKPERKTRLFDENFFNREPAFKRSEDKERHEVERPARAAKKTVSAEIIRLNKFVAQSGICSRRKAAEMVKAGEIKVNGEVNTNPAYETKEGDVITYKGEVLKKEEKLIYLLLNKPKNFITTAEDEKGRKTVLDLVKDKYEERLFPVGRLDRNTTGLLLLTNDGALAKKLSHPSHQIKKIYQVELDKNLKITDLDKIKEGVMLEDGKAEVDSVDYIEAGKKNQIGIEIHSGKNRIVRRIFESLGYEVVRLDRTYFAGLTKKDLPRGFSRELTEKEIIMLRHFTNRRKEG
nr:pseudouridine synthase [Saprospiraceae bacterium]